MLDKKVGRCYNGDRKKINRNNKEEIIKMKNFKAITEKDFQTMKNQLTAKGYKRTENCYWYETFTKDDDIVSLERDF